MNNKDKNNFEIIKTKRIIINSVEEILIERTKSSEKDLIKIGRWKLDDSGGWRSCGGFSINSESFPKFLKGLILFFLSIRKHH